MSVHFSCAKKQELVTSITYGNISCGYNDEWVYQKLLSVLHVVTVLLKVCIELNKTLLVFPCISDLILLIHPFYI